MGHRTCLLFFSANASWLFRVSSVLRGVPRESSRSTGDAGNFISELVEREIGLPILFVAS